ncbi:MAG TPA: hypothetical protein VKA91_02310 [Nitrososphaeraceae archaeon]|nr:hypothetical protein [Nitrososphaeraceae archaeon]
MTVVGKEKQDILTKKKLNNGRILEISSPQKKKTENYSKIC